MGHTKVRCSKPTADLDNAMDASGTSVANLGGDGMGTAGVSEPPAAEWQTSAPDAGTGASPW